MRKYFKKYRDVVIYRFDIIVRVVASVIIVLLLIGEVWFGDNFTLSWQAVFLIVMLLFLIYKGGGDDV